MQHPQAQETTLQRQHCKIQPQSHPCAASLGALFFLAILTISTAVSYAQQTEIDDRSSLQYRALQARNAGKSSVTINIEEGLLAAVPESLQDALNNTSVVVAQQIGVAVTSNKYLITTWRKYRLLERLSEQSSIPADPLPEDIPSSLLPLNTSEFLVPEPGGSVVLNGVKIKTRLSTLTEPTNMTKHLMFLLFHCSGAVAVLNYGQSGRFSVNAYEGVHAWIPEDHNRLAALILRNGTGTLSDVRRLSQVSVPR